MHRTLLALLSSSVLLGIIGLIYFGLVVTLWEYDRFFISTFTVFISLSAFIIGPYRPSIPFIVSGLAMRLGLFGTIVGFTYMLANIGSTSPEELWQMFQGAYVALHTTAVGLVCSTVLYLEGLIIEDYENEP